MSDHVTLFGAASSGRTYEPALASEASWVAYAAVRSPEEAPTALSAKSLIQRAGGLFLEERAEGGRVDVGCIFVESEGAKRPGSALLLRIRGADQMIQLDEKVKLSIGEHLIVPVDAVAEVELTRFHSIVQRFPEDTRRSILATLRRPALDWEVDQVKAALGGHRDVPVGTPKTKGRSWKRIVLYAAGGLLALGILAAAGYVGFHPGLVGFGGGDKPPATTTATTEASSSAPPVTSTLLKPQESLFDERIDKAYGALMAEMRVMAAANNAEIKDLSSKVDKDKPDWRQNENAVLVLAVLYHRALGAKLDGEFYKTPEKSKALTGLLNQGSPSRDALLRYVICTTKSPAKPQILPPAATPPAKCDNLDAKTAAETLEWIVASLKHQAQAGAPGK